MRKILIIFTTLIALIAVFLVGVTQFYLPAHVQAKAQQIMQDLGFAEAMLPAPQTGFGTITYRNISLDADQISTIKELRLTYDPVNFLFLGRFRAFEITGLYLTGEQMPDNMIALSGWTYPVSPKALTLIPARTVTITDSRVSLLTENLGGINIRYDVQARQRANHAYDFQARFSSEQKYFSLSGTASGFISPDLWDTQFDIANFKLTIPSINSGIMRGAGTLSIAEDGIEQRTILGEIQAGGLRIIGTPWTNAKLSIQNTGTAAPELFLAASSLDQKGIELSLNFTPMSPTSNLSAQIYSPKADILGKYLEGHEAFRDLIGELDGFDSDKSIDINLLLQEITENSYNLQYQTNGIDKMVAIYR